MEIIGPNVTVIIPTLNGAHFLKELLSIIKNQSLKNIEVIVIDSQSTDETRLIAKNFGVKLITIPRAQYDHGGTRNLAATRASGDYLVFLTQDSVPANSFTLEKLTLPLGKNKIIVSYGRQIPRPGTKITDKFLRFYNYPSKSVVRSREDIKVMGIRAFQNSNACAAYCRRVFFEMGGFKSPVVSNEDMLFAAKAILAGYKVAYTADAVVYHSHNYNFTSLFKRYFDIAASLEHEPIIKELGNANSNGFKFLKEQLKYIKSEKKLYYISEALLEAIFKYSGYKLGEHHHIFPSAIKKHLGFNKKYWSV